MELNNWKTPLRGAREAKAAAAPTAQPRASAEIKSLTGTAWQEWLLNLYKTTTQPVTALWGAGGNKWGGKTLQSLPGPWNSHILPS